MCIRDRATGEATTGKLSFKLRVEEVARNIAELCGFSQGMTYSFESPKVFDKLLLDKDDPMRQAIQILSLIHIWDIRGSLRNPDRQERIWEGRKSAGGFL